MPDFFTRPGSETEAWPPVVCPACLRLFTVSVVIGDRSQPLFYTPDMDRSNTYGLMIPAYCPLCGWQRGAPIPAPPAAPDLDELPMPEPSLDLAKAWREAPPPILDENAEMCLICNREIRIGDEVAVSNLFFRLGLQIPRILAHWNCWEQWDTADREALDRHSMISVVKGRGLYQETGHGHPIGLDGKPPHRTIYKGKPLAPDGYHNAR